MANTYSWRFPTLQTYTHKDGVENIVYIVHWYYKGECSPDSGSHSYETFGAQEIAPYVSGSPFVPYEELTKETVQGWVESAMGSQKIEQMQQQIDQQIANLINPPVAFLTPPWAVTPTPTPSPTTPPEPTPLESPLIPPLGPTLTPTPSG